MERRRADVILAERGLFPSREQARAAILAGDVRVEGELLLKAGTQINPAAAIEVRVAPRFVSRGGVKLAHALDVFGMDVTGARAVDVGASTGGFTDCLLQRGAASVAALDVGYGQLAWSLRSDDRVDVFERTNIRSADPESIGAPFDIATVDVSFIGLATVLPHVLALLAEDGDLVALVKPQFEAGKGRVGKKGVVKDRSVHREVLESIVRGVHERGLRVRALAWSPIKGPEGNIEFWMWASRGGAETVLTPEEVVEAAHQELGE